MIAAESSQRPPTTRPCGVSCWSCCPRVLVRRCGQRRGRPSRPWLRSNPPMRTVAQRAIVSQLSDVDKSAVSRRVRVALDAGYLVNLEERRGRPHRLDLGEPMPDDLEILPSPDALTEGELRGCAVAGGGGGASVSAVRKCPQCRGQVTEPARCINGHDQPDDPYERLAAMLGEHIDYDRLAELVAARLREFVTDLAAQVPEPEQLVDAHTVARLTGMSERWVYDHADELGAVRAGDGPRPRLRFDPGLVRAKLKRRNGDAPAPPPHESYPSRVKARRER